MGQRSRNKQRNGGTGGAKTAPPALQGRRFKVVRHNSFSLRYLGGREFVSDSDIRAMGFIPETLVHYGAIFQVATDGE